MLALRKMCATVVAFSIRCHRLNDLLPASKSPLSRQRYLVAVISMLLTYVVLRVLFREFSELKDVFIYPVGWLVAQFLGSGQPVQGDWWFTLGTTRFVLNESCSGTTFFSLLCGYFVLRLQTHRCSPWWLVATYPLVLLANTVRVLSATYVHVLLAGQSLPLLQDSAHVITGTVTFLGLLIAVALYVEGWRGAKVS